MAAPGRIEDPNWHRSRELPQECEWKQGESARGKKTFLRRQEGGRSWRLPLVGEAVVRFAVPEKVLTRPAFSWKPRPQGSGQSRNMATGTPPFTPLSRPHRGQGGRSSRS